MPDAGAKRQTGEKNDDSDSILAHATEKSLNRCDGHFTLASPRLSDPAML